MTNFNIFKAAVFYSAFAIILFSISATVNAANVAQINFQPSASPVPAGYQKDDGSMYTILRGYGWDSWPTPDSRDRDVNPDQKLDTFVFSSSVANWNYDIANGNYLVTLASGDASWAQGPHRVLVEGVLAIDNAIMNVNQFAAVADLPVTVNDGKLTITIGGGGGNTMLNYVVIRGQ